MLSFFSGFCSILWNPLLVVLILSSVSLSVSHPEVDECQINPYICGQGICYNTAGGYTCHCDEGYHLDDTQTTCVGEESSGQSWLLRSKIILCKSMSAGWPNQLREAQSHFFNIGSIRILSHTDKISCSTSNRYMNFSLWTKDKC